MSAKVVTRKGLAAAFAEWDRRYREDPEGFDADYQASSTSAEYGERAADYLLKVLRSQGAVATVAGDTATLDAESGAEVTCPWCDQDQPGSAVCVCRKPCGVAYCHWDDNAARGAQS